METQVNSSQKIVLAIGSLTGWFALILQLYLIIVNNSAVLTMPDILTRYFSFYTIESNIIVAVCLTTLLIAPASRAGKFFSRTTTLTAITVYITVVGLVYNAVLRFLWAPQGIDRLADELLHLAMPLIFIFYWAVFVPKTSLKWNSFLPWLIFPLAYCIYILIRGSFVHIYPYPFMDVTVLGLQTVLINCVLVTTAFLLIALVLIGISRFKSKSIV
jgi:hypothetical protein